MIRIAFPCLAILFAALLSVAVDGVPAQASDDIGAIKTATITKVGANTDNIAIPAILSTKDAELYRRIFDVQDEGHWQAAKKLIAKLDNRLLMGHVLAQRYLHPTRYRSRYKELKAWMGKYADHPDARRIYNLARHRRPRNWKAPKPPVNFASYANGGKTRSPTLVKKPKKRLSRHHRRQVSAWKRQIRGQLRNGWTKATKRLLQNKELQNLFSEVEYDQYSTRLAARYLTDGRDDWALEWASKAAKRSGPYIPEAHWIAGLTAWRMRRFDVAAKNFTAVAKAQDTSTWLISAGAFWAARSNLLGRHPENVNHLLMLGANYPRTFYGLLARQLLGIKTAFHWTMPVLEKPVINNIVGKPAGKRALALIQAGMYRRAERELRNLSAGADGDMTKGILALASRTFMPSLAVRLDERLHPNGGGYDGASYPLPQWPLKNGYSIDKALVYAMVRQESRFNPHAKSHAGARGLMQLMPRTASFVAKDRRLRGSKRRNLFKPEVSLTLGQKYIQMLLNNNKIKGNMFMMAAAWNGGPGNLNKWRRNINHMDDALFFIETIPSRETRIFIERIFTNLWIYRNRMGQQTHSLNDIASGNWPYYIAQDQQSVQVVENVEDRKPARISPR